MYIQIFQDLICGTERYNSFIKKAIFIDHDENENVEDEKEKAIKPILCLARQSYFRGNYTIKKTLGS